VADINTLENIPAHARCAAHNPERKARQRNILGCTLQKRRVIWHRNKLHVRVR